MRTAISRDQGNENEALVMRLDKQSPPMTAGFDLNRKELP
jgi:hypothetical protein